MTKTERNLWSAFIGEAKANRMYTAYAMKAMEEGLPEVAQIFLEVAGAETIHAVSHLRVMGEVKSTLENLRTVTEGEAYEMEVMYPRMVREAEEEGRADAVATFRIALDRERYHQNLFQKTLDELVKKQGVAVPIEKPRTTPATITEPGASGTEIVAATRGEVLTEKTRIAALGRIREVIFGMQDGLISTLALVSAVAFATGQNFGVIVAGLAGGLGGVISMSAGSYLSSKAEIEFHKAEIDREAREISAHPAEEMAELIEIYQHEGLSYEEASRLAERVASDQDLWLKSLAEKELGLSPEMTVLESPLKNAATMGVSFFLGAALPVLPYFFLPAMRAIYISVAATLGGLFLLGIGKTRITRKNPLLSGLEVVGIGTASAALGYVLGTLLPRLFGIEMPS